MGRPSKYPAESSECPVCGSGAVMLPPLKLKTSRLSARKDFAESIAGEFVVSERAVRILRDADVRGVVFEPVQSAGGRGVTWCWPKVVSQPVNVATQTKWGIDPFDPDIAGQYRCPLGHRPGLAVLSELYFEQGTGDVLLTEQYWGARRGLLRPTRMLVVSKKVHELIRRHRLTGLRVEIAHQVIPPTGRDSEGDRS